MISHSLLAIYLRDLNKLKEEVSLYKNENDLWIVKGEIKNSAGTLVTHLMGSLKHFIGAQLGNTGYVRNRDKEFSGEHILRKSLLSEIGEGMEVLNTTLPKISDEIFHANYPIEFLGQKRLTGEILFILYGHLNYHLGQINYHRRLIG